MDSRILQGIIRNQRKYNILKELFRKSIHICSAFVPLILYYFYWPTIILLIAAAFFYTITQILMLKGINVFFFSKIINLASRKRDENKFVLGPLTLVFGILFAALLLPFKPAMVGIFALSFGDGFASLVGKLFGKITIPGAGGKTVAGSMACFLAVYTSTFVSTGNCFVSLLIALIAMSVEVLPLADFDNLIIPLIIGTSYYYLSIYFPL
ncbi:MAG: phosphatidate cytidylyltransferase [Treponema sp.]|nr:phosphatidate cytidylyltransferase [Treponema sp.]